jgi:hypothetical protein
MTTLEAEQPDVIRKAFPRTWYYPKLRLVTWFPCGVLNEAFIDQVFNFIELEERLQDAPFDRYTDLSGLTSIRIELPYIFRAARRRRQVSQPVKSAIFASDLLSFGVAEIYARQMARAMIDVSAFQDREAAAEWLEVPVRILQPPK